MSTRRFSLTGCIIGVVVLLASGAALAEPLDMYVLGLPPCLLSQSPATGACVEYQDLFIRETGLDIRLKVLPPARLIHELPQPGQHFAITVLVPDQDWGSVKQIAKVDEISMLLVPAKSLAATHILEPEYWRGRTIGLLNLGCGGAIARRMPGSKTYVVTDLQQSLLMLRSGRIDGCCGALNVLSIDLGKPDMNWEQFGPPILITKLPFWVLGSPDLDEHTVALLAAAALKHSGTGEFHRMLMKYTLPVPAPLEMQGPPQPGP